MATTWITTGTIWSLVALTKHRKRSESSDISVPSVGCLGAVVYKPTSFPGQISKETIASTALIVFVQFIVLYCVVYISADLFCLFQTLNCLHVSRNLLCIILTE